MPHILRPATLALFLLVLAAFSPSVFAHHPMGGATPSTLWQGLLSGFGHPVIGLDHFAFILALGLLSWRLQGAYRYLLPLAFVAATVAGTALHLLALPSPFNEAVVALSLLALGTLLWLALRPPPALGALLLALAGLFHGYAYGETVVGAEAGPVFAYLTGFALIQYLIVLGVRFAAARLGPQHRGLALSRWAGAAAASTGALFLAQALS